jgi:hypothetical protein
MGNLYFITGMPRSGTTIVSSGLNKIRGVVVPKETHYFEYLNTSFREKILPSKRLELAKKILQDNDVPNFEDTNGMPFDEMGLYIDVINKIKKHFKAKLIVEKTPNHYKYLGKISSYQTNIKVIHLVRDPRDVYVSRQKVPWGRKSVYAIASEFKKSIAIIEDLKKQNIECMVVKYEDLIVNPRKYFKEICAFFDIEFSDSILDVRQTADYDVKQEYWKSKNNEALDSGNAYKWKRYSSERWPNVITCLSVAELKLFGYEYTYSHVTKSQLFLELLFFYKEGVTKMYRKLLGCLK